MKEAISGLHPSICCTQERTRNGRAWVLRPHGDGETGLQEGALEYLGSGLLWPW